MTWLKVDDGFADHPKLAELDGAEYAEAVALWLAAGCWCARALTDGRVPPAKVRALVPFDTKRAAAALVLVGLWDATDDGYQFHDWLEYQPSKAKVLADRKMRSERGKKGAAASHGPTQEASRRQARARLVVSRRQAEPEQPSRLAHVAVIASAPGPGPGPVPDPAPKQDSVDESTRASVGRVFSTWVKLHVDPGRQGQAKLNPARRKRIAARLREGYSVERLHAALRGALADTWIMGLDPKSPKAYRGLETILRDGSQVERLEAMDGVPQADARYDLRRGVAPVGDFSDLEASDG